MTEARGPSRRKDSGASLGGRSSCPARSCAGARRQRTGRSSSGPAGSDWDPPADPGFKVTLAGASSDLEYLHPFYFGVSHGKALIFMFERPRAGAELRFAQSPSGGGERNPAWDFVHFQRDYEVGKEFSFRARLVVRDFRGREDAVKAYEEWSGEKVERPE